MKGHWENSDDNEVKQKEGICVSILDASKHYHFVGLLVIGNEDDVTYKYKEDEVTDKDIDFLCINKAGDGNVKSHDYKAKHHLVD